MKDKLATWILFILSGIFGFAVVNMILNSPLSLSQLFDYNAFIGGKYGIEISGYIGWAYLLTLLFVSTLIFSLYFYFKHYKQKNNGLTDNLTNDNSSNLNNKLFKVNEAKVPLVSNKVEYNKSTPEQKFTTEKVILNEKQIEPDQKKEEIIINHYPSPEYSPESSPLESDEIYISEYFQSGFNEEKADEKELPRSLADEITEKLEEKILGLYNKTSSEIQSYLSQLTELQKQIIEIREDIAKEGVENNAASVSVDGKESEGDKKKKKLERMREMEREANILKDKILEEQREEKTRVNSQYIRKEAVKDGSFI